MLQIRGKICQKKKKLGGKDYEINRDLPSGDNKIVEIETDKIVMPKDSLFGLLMYPNEINKLSQAFKNYSFTKHAVVDLNAISPESKGYNGRLVKDYYLVKKKY